MTSERSTRFDRTYLPAATFEVAVITDTHHILDPHMYAEKGDSVSPEIVSGWSQRANAALGLARDLAPDLVFHVGDLTQEYAGHPSHPAGKANANEQLESFRLPIRYAPGNMDIGDKQDPTSPALAIDHVSLQTYENECGTSYYSVEHMGVTFIVLNSQLLNSDLEAATDQRVWLEETLETARGTRVVLFLHMPLFLVDPTERGFGSYEVVDEPARSEILRLIDAFKIEAVFSGHIHFRSVNRYASCWLFTAPSTTLTRPGFCELFPVAPPEGGWGDLPKLGLLLARVMGDGLSIHMIRSHCENGVGLNGVPKNASHVLTRVSRDIPTSPLGAYLRLPITRFHEGVIAYPNLIRQPLRDDYPALALMELGARYVRFPIEDLADPRQRDQLSVLQEIGISLIGTELVDRSSLRRLADSELTAGSCIELQLPQRLGPTESDAELIHGLIKRGADVSLAPLMMDAVETIHRRSRVGYRPEELPEIDDMLGRMGVTSRAVCSLAACSTSAWDAALSFAAYPAQNIAGLDFVVALSADPDASVASATEAMLASATIRDCRLFIDCLQEVDRSAVLTSGMLDRRSNPLPVFHALRVMNTVLFHDRAPGEYDVVRNSANSRAARLIECRSLQLLLASGTALVREIGDRAPAGKTRIFDLIHGLELGCLSADAWDYITNSLERTYLIVTRKAEASAPKANGEPKASP